MTLQFEVLIMKILNITPIRYLKQVPGRRKETDEKFWKYSNIKRYFC